MIRPQDYHAHDAHHADEAHWDHVNGPEATARYKARTFFSLYFLLTGRWAGVDWWMRTMGRPSTWVC